MSIFGRIFAKNAKAGSYIKRKEMAESLHGLPVKYVTERRNDNEDVIGRGGHLALHGEEFIVDTSGDTVFRCPVADLDASMLMSGDGVILHGPGGKDGAERTITVHFVYYRK